MTVASPEPWRTAADLAAHFGIAEKTVHERCRTGRWRSVLIHGNKGRRFSPEMFAEICAIEAAGAGPSRPSAPQADPSSIPLRSVAKLRKIQERRAS